MFRVLGALVCLAVSTTVPATAFAADVPVRYVVDAKALKDAIAGTPLTFELFSDAGCSTSLFSTQVAVEAVAQISPLKLLRPKGAPKPPKAAELLHTLTGVTPATVLYLRVSGTGVVPVGSTCQAQLAVPTFQQEWHWISVIGDATVRSSSPSLAGTMVVRPAGEPVGVYCLIFPDGAPVNTEGAIGSVQKSFGGDSPATLTVTSAYGHACNPTGFDVAVDTLLNGALANLHFVIMVPGN